MSSLQIEIGGQSHRVELSQNSADTAWIAVFDGRQLEVDARMLQPGVLSLIVQRRSYRCVLDEGPVETAVVIGDQRYLFTIDDPRSLTARLRKAGAAGGTQVIKAPMPGRILRLMIAVGDQVEAQQPVAVIEAMKMQNELRSARAGKIAAIHTEAGATVAAGAILITIE